MRMNMGVLPLPVPAVNAAARVGPARSCHGHSFLSGKNTGRNELWCQGAHALHVPNTLFSFFRQEISRLIPACFWDKIILIIRAGSQPPENQPLTKAKVACRPKSVACGPKNMVSGPLFFSYY